jgi:hypothetical protein
MMTNKKLQYGLYYNKGFYPKNEDSYERSSETLVRNHIPDYTASHAKWPLPVHYHVHKHPSLDSILSQTNPVHIHQELQ